MVACRAGFQAAGHYRFIADAVSEAAQLWRGTAQPGGGEARPELVVEAGAGTGYYLGAVLDALPASAGLALDVSKAALRRAAKAHPRAAAALCDVWGKLPVSDAAAGLVLSIFAPRNGAGFRRILSAQGTVVVVSPTPLHLLELVGPLGLLSVGANKDEAVAASLGEGFVQVDEQRCDQLLQLKHDDVRALVRMGPSAWHLDPEKLTTAIAGLPEIVPVTASVHVSRYRLR
jgi:23S rRNA (guanine745-N1)-methyltransferase